MSTPTQPAPELFAADEVAMDSPRLAWLKANGLLVIHHNPPHCEGQANWFCGELAWWPNKTGVDWLVEEVGQNGDSRVGQGYTENEAIVTYATMHGIPLWNEQGGTP